MSLSKEQLKHDRINLGRLVKRLEKAVSDDSWAEGDQKHGSDAWVKAEGMAQKIGYARQLLLNVDYYEELDPRTQSRTASQQRYLQTIRETLDKLDNIVDLVKQRLETEPITETTYLSLMPLPTEEESNMPEHATEPSPEAELIPSDSASEPHRPLVEDPALERLSSLSTLRNSEQTQSPLTSRPPPTSSLLSSSLQTHEELSNELSRMATQLKRNALHFSDSLDKDKSHVQSAAEVLEKNYDTMTKERVRLRDHRSKSFGTTWMVFGALLVVSIAWVLIFFVIRVT